MSILKDRETTVVLNDVDVNVVYNYEPRYVNPEYAYGCTDEVIEIQSVTYGELELLPLLNKNAIDEIERQLSDQMCDYYANRRDEKFYEN
jgi:hypothetical protein